MEVSKNNSSGLERNTSPLDRWRRGESNNPDVTVNVFYSASAGSDAGVIEEIGERLMEGTPIALRNAKSICVFIPATLTRHEFGKNVSSFKYENGKQFFEGVKLQYLTHKELLSTELLLQISEALLCQQRESISKSMLNF